MALDEITWTYAAKEFAKDLVVTPQDIPLGNKFALTLINIPGWIKHEYSSRFNDDYKRALEDGEEIERLDREYFESIDIHTDLEKDAWTIAHYTGLCMSRLIGHETDPSKIKKMKNNHVTEIEINKNTFDIYMRNSLKNGIWCLNGQYFRTEKNYCVVNSDFELKAYDWLKNEVYSGLSKGNDVLLLERAIVRKRANNKLNLKSHYTP